MKELIDPYGRGISYLRISVTSACNLHCVYCAKQRRHRIVSQLGLEEVERVARCAVRLGIRSIRITGGEPLLHPNIVELVRRLSRLEGISKIMMTTNGLLLRHYAEALKTAGLNGINISLDSLSADKLRLISGTEPESILEGIEVALYVGFECVKLNCVVLRSLNLDEVEHIAALSIERPIHVRFLEYQPIGCKVEEFEREFVGMDEVLSRLQSKFKMEPVECSEKPLGDGPACYWRIDGAVGMIGFIAPVSKPFCSSCNRLRITSDGMLRPCLAYDLGVDVKKALGEGDKAVEEAFRTAVMLKPAGHNFASAKGMNLNRSTTSTPMNVIGG